MQVHADVNALVGNTPLLKIGSLSRLTGAEIFVKCEYLNPGGSIKDRAAQQMILDAHASGALRPGMKIVEGTAGNTGIGLAVIGAAFGHKVKVVMPRGQTAEKQRILTLFGAEIQQVDLCPFTSPNHFYHTARRVAEEDPANWWWANQFDNLSNFKAHYTRTGPEILAQTEGRLSALVSSAGTGGTIAGNSRFLKERLPGLKVILVDPLGSGLCHYLKHGEFKTEGESIAEGIGIMRLVANFKEAVIDAAFTLPDADALTIADHVREHDGLVLGSSSALNVAAAVKTALSMGSGSRVVTFACDLGERSYSKLYDRGFLASKGLAPHPRGIEGLIADYGTQLASL